MIETRGGDFGKNVPLFGSRIGTHFELSAISRILKDQKNMMYMSTADPKTTIK
jgi:hypothetical protein